MAVTRIKYETILNNAVTELMADKDKLVKCRESLEPEYRKVVSIEINKRINTIDKKLADIQKELLLVRKNTIDSMNSILRAKEEEIVYHSEVARSIHDLGNVSMSEYVNGNILNLENSIREQKNKMLIDVEQIKEDINEMFLIEALGVKSYDIDAISISDKDEENHVSREFRTKEGFFFVYLDDKNVLVLIKEADENIDDLNLEYKKKVPYKGKVVYVDIKHNIPTDKLPF